MKTQQSATSVLPFDPVGSLQEASARQKIAIVAFFNASCGTKKQNSSKGKLETVESQQKQYATINHRLLIIGLHPEEQGPFGCDGRPIIVDARVLVRPQQNNELLLSIKSRSN